MTLHDGWYRFTHDRDEYKQLIFVHLIVDGEISRGDVTIAEYLEWGYRYEPVIVLTPTEYDEAIVAAYARGVAEAEASAHDEPALIMRVWDGTPVGVVNDSAHTWEEALVERVTKRVMKNLERERGEL